MSILKKSKVFGFMSTQNAQIQNLPSQSQDRNLFQERDFKSFSKVGSRIGKQKCEIEGVTFYSNLVQEIKNLDDAACFRKAVRHFFDSMELRTPRHDIDFNYNPFVYKVYTIQQNPSFQNMLCCMAFSYMGLSIIEPSNRYDTEMSDNYGAFVYEMIIICCFWLEFLMELVHLNNSKDKNFKEKFSIKFLSKSLILLIFLVDASYYHNYKATDSLRIGRYFRPFLILLYNQELRRTFKSVIYSVSQIIQLLLFFTLMTLFWAVLGYRLIGDLDSEIPYDDLTQNFNDIGKASNILYSLISFDGYPECLLPSYTYSPYFIIYFVIYTLLYLMIFLPIPVAIVFDTFRTQRGKMVILDRIKQKEALFVCFMSIDKQNEKRMTYAQFYKLMSSIYLHKKRLLKNIRDLFLLLDDNDSKTITINEFFEITDSIESDSKYNIPSFADQWWWDKFRMTINKYFKVKEIAKNQYFENFMIFILILNSTTVIASQFTEDQNLNHVFDLIDEISLYFYIVECIFKIIGYGITKYFEDGWNQFDFAIVLLSAFSNFLQNMISVVKSAKSVKSSRILRVARINKLLKAFKALRTFKFFNVCLEGFNILIQLKSMISRIFLCLPMIVKFIPMMCMVIYLWAIIGMENLNTDTHSYRHGSTYQTQEYATFNDFIGATLLLYQVAIEAKFIKINYKITSWSSLTYDFAYKFNDFYFCMFYFCFFHLIIQLILISLVKGIKINKINKIKGVVWEIFTVVEQETNQQRQRQQHKQNNNIGHPDDRDQTGSQYGMKPSKGSFYTDDDKINNFQQKYDEFIIALLTDQIQSDVGDEDHIQESMIEQNLRYEGRFMSVMNDDGEEKDLLNRMMKRESNFSISLNEQNIPHSQITPSINEDDKYVEQQSGIKVKSLFYQQNIKPIWNKHNFNPFNIKSNSLCNIENLDINKQNIEIKVTNEQQQQLIIELNKRIILLTSYFNKMKGEKSNKINRSNGIMDSNILQYICSDDEESMTLYNKQIMQEVLKERVKQNRQIEPKTHAKILRNGTIFKMMDSFKRKTSFIEIKEQDFSSNFIMKKAMLKETNPDVIRKIENDYFYENYGAFFTQIEDINIGPNLDHQSFLLDNLYKLSRHMSVDASPFFQMIRFVEQDISSILLQRGSLFKFVFLDNHNNWVTLDQPSIDQELASLVLLPSNTIWDYQEQVWKEENQFYICRDIFQPGLQTKNQDDILEGFNACSISLTPYCNFHQVASDHSIYDLFLYNMNTPLDSEDKQISIKKIAITLLSLRGNVTKENQSQKIQMKAKSSKNIEDIHFENLKFNNSKGMVQEQLSLPFAYTIEMLQQLSSILQLNKQTFFKRIDNLLNSRYENMSQKLKIDERYSIAKDQDN